MLKESSSLYKMPYFNVQEQTLKYVSKIQTNYQEITCICNEDSCEDGQGGFKYSFGYKSTPTIEPVSYKLKGYSQQANLDYDDIGVDISDDVILEIQNKINNILTISPDGLPINIFDDIQNEFNNQKLLNNIFQRNKSFLYKNEIYNELGYLNTLIPSLKISSNIYTVNIQQSSIQQD